MQNISTVENQPINYSYVNTAYGSNQGASLGAQAAGLVFPNPLLVLHPTLFISIDCLKSKVDILNVTTANCFTAGNFNRNSLPICLVPAHKVPKVFQICPFLLETPSFSPRSHRSSMQQSRAQQNQQRTPPKTH